MDEVPSSHLDAILQIVESHGGSIILEKLEGAYRSRYSINLPYIEYGYSNSQEFLTALGLKVSLIAGEFLVSTVALAKSHDLDYEIDPLCVSLNNGLVFGYENDNDRRTVSIQSKPSERASHRKKLVRKIQSAARLDEPKDGKSSSPEFLNEHSDRDPYYSSKNSSYDSGYDNSIFSNFSNLSDNGYHLNNYSICIEKNNFNGSTNYASEALDYFPKPNVNVNNVPNVPDFSCNSHLIPAVPSDFVVDVGNIPDISCYQFDINRITDNIPNLNYDFKSDITIPKSFNDIYHSSSIPLFTESSKEFFDHDAKFQRRLEQIIVAQKESISTNDIETLYYQCYPESLPKNWLQTLRKSNKFYCENLEKITLIYPPRKLNSPPTLASLPQLKYPEHVPWKIHITVVSSTGSVWFCISELEFNFRYENLHDEMRKHYETEVPKTAKILKCDELYAVRYQNQVFRVQVLESQHELVKCFFIDIGSIKQLKTDQLIPLHEKFTNTPAMAVHGALTDLEQYDTCRYVSSKLQKRIEGKNGLAMVNYIRRDERVLLNLFMTGYTDGVNVNNTVLKEILSELKGPKLEPGQTYQVRMLWIEKDKARVQIKSPCLDLLEKSLAEAKEIIGAAETDLYLKYMHDLCLNNEVYLAKYKNSWQRISPKQIFDSTRVVALFIDLGKIELLDFANIVKLIPKFSDTLAIIPPQAIELNIVIKDPITLSIVYDEKTTEIEMINMKIIRVKPQLCAHIYADLPKSYQCEYASYV